MRQSSIEKPIKLMQLNIWQGRLLIEILRYIRQENPDILCLQEVYSRNKSPLALHDFHQSYQSIRELFPGGADGEYDKHGFFSPHFDLKGQFEYGNAILSKYPFVHKPQSKFACGNFVSYKTLDNFVNNQLCLQQAQVDIHGCSVNIFNYHGYWDPDPMGKPESLEAMKVVASEIAKTSGPIIFAGDLNVKPESPALEPLKKLPLINLTQEKRLPSTLSEYGKVRDVACDYIFISEEINAITFGIGRRKVPVSDHEPLVLEFTL